MGDREKREGRKIWVISGLALVLLGAVSFVFLGKGGSESQERRSRISAANGSLLTESRNRSEGSHFTGKKLEADVLIARLQTQMLAGEALDPEMLSKLKKIVRSLKEPGQRVSMVSLFPRWLYPDLGDVAMEIAQEVESEIEGSVTTEYSSMVGVLGRTPTNEAGEWLLNELKQVPDFEYPEVPPSIWSMEFHSRGALGDVAKAVVINGGLGDAAVMDAYVQAILDSAGERQQVLLWALGESRDYADFEFLAAVRGSIKDPVNAREIDLSLNKIAAHIGHDADPASDPDHETSGPHFFSVFPMLGNERQVLAKRQQVEHAKATAYLEANGLKDPEFSTKY